MDTNSEELLRKYLDGDLSPEEEREALHYIAEDAEMRSMLRFEQQLSRASTGLRNLSSADVPAGFSDRLISRIEAEETATAESGSMHTLGSRIKALWESVLEPRQIQLRPLDAMAMAVVLVVIMLVGTPYFGVQQADQLQQQQLVSQSTTSEGASIESVSDNGEEVWTRFVYIDKNAESVSVAGDFSNWEPIALTKKQLNGEQVWTGLVPMERGEHRYMFVRNGEQWVTDPLATVQQDDGFGNKNAVIYL